MLHDFYILFLFLFMGCNYPANDMVGGQELELHHSNALQSPNGQRHVRGEHM